MLLWTNLQLLHRRETNQNKLSWNNLFITQTYLLGADLLQQGVPKEWLNRSNNIERPFWAQMTMAKVEAIKRTKHWQAEHGQLYIEDKEWDALPNDDDTVNKKDDSGYESENWGEPPKLWRWEIYHK